MPPSEKEIMASLWRSYLENEILVALIGLGATIYSSTVGTLWYFLRKQKELHRQEIIKVVDEAALKAAHRERQVFHDQVLSPFYPIKEWTRFVKKVKDLNDQTEVDRFLVLVAVNGVNSPTHASVVWDHRTEGEDYFYNDVPLDDDYIARVNAIKKGKIRFKTEEVSGTKIGAFYQNEGVTEAIWAMIGKRRSFTTEQIAYKYISVATHREGGFSNPKEIERLVDSLVADFRALIGVAGFEHI